MDRNAMRSVVALAVSAGAAGALLYLAVAAGGFGAVLLGYLAPLPLFLIGLWAGATAAALAGLVGAILTAILTGSDLAPLAFLATAAIPAALVSATALRETAGGDAGDEDDFVQGRPGDALMALVAVAAVSFVAAVLLASGEDGGLKGMLSRALASILAQLAGLGRSPGSEVETLGSEAMWMTPALPGIIATSWMLMTVVNGVLAQGALLRFGLNRRPSMRFADLALPRWVPAAFGAAVAGALVLPDPMGFWAVNFALILATPLIFAGLAVAHAFAESRSARPALLVAFYVFLFVFGWPIALLVGLGVIETWTGLSRRLRARRPGRED